MITGGDPHCSYVIDLLKRVLFNSLPSYHGDVHSPSFQIVLAAGGVKIEAYVLRKVCSLIFLRYMVQ